jgi:hypothetical protein
MCSAVWNHPAPTINFQAAWLYSATTMVNIPSLS